MTDLIKLKRQSKQLFKQLLSRFGLDNSGIEKNLKYLNRKIQQKTPETHILVLPQYKGIYLAIPKVANSTCKKLFGKLSGVKNVSAIINTQQFPSIKKEQLTLYENYWKFCFVRNPWDRLVSCYCDKIKNSGSSRVVMTI